jgi:hypothetical protein
MLRWAAINGGGSVGASVHRGFQEGDAAGRRVGVRGALSRTQQKVRRRGEARRCRGRRPAATREEGWRREVEEGPDRWAPPVSRRERERREVGRRVPSWAKRGERAAGKGKEGEKMKWVAGQIGKGFGVWFETFGFSFLSFFKSF